MILESLYLHLNLRNIKSFFRKFKKIDNIPRNVTNSFSDRVATEATLRVRSISQKALMGVCRFITLYSCLFNVVCRKASTVCKYLYTDSH